MQQTGEKQFGLTISVQKVEDIAQGHFFQNNLWLINNPSSASSTILLPDITSAEITALIAESTANPFGVAGNDNIFLDIL